MDRGTFLRLTDLMLAKPEWDPDESYYGTYGAYHPDEPGKTLPTDHQTSSPSPPLVDNPIQSTGPGWDPRFVDAIGQIDSSPIAHSPWVVESMPGSPLEESSGGVSNIALIESFHAPPPSVVLPTDSQQPVGSHNVQAPPYESSCAEMVPQSDPSSVDFHPRASGTNTYPSHVIEAQLLKVSEVLGHFSNCLTLHKGWSGDLPLSVVEKECLKARHDEQMQEALSHVNVLKSLIGGTVEIMTSAALRADFKATKWSPKPENLERLNCTLTMLDNLERRIIEGKRTTALSLSRNATDDCTIQCLARTNTELGMDNAMITEVQSMVGLGKALIIHEEEVRASVNTIKSMIDESCHQSAATPRETLGILPLVTTPEPQLAKIYSDICEVSRRISRERNYMGRDSQWWGRKRKKRVSDQVRASQSRDSPTHPGDLEHPNLSAIARQYRVSDQRARSSWNMKRQSMINDVRTIVKSMKSLLVTPEARWPSTSGFCATRGNTETHIPSEVVSLYLKSVEKDLEKGEADGVQLQQQRRAKKATLDTQRKCWTEGRSEDREHEDDARAPPDDSTIFYEQSLGERRGRVDLQDTILTHLDIMRKFIEPHYGLDDLASLKLQVFMDEWKHIEDNSTSTCELGAS